MQIVVLASLDETTHMAPRVASDCSINQLKVMWSEQFGVSLEDILFRNIDDSIPEDSSTVQELASIRTNGHVVYLSVEERVSLSLQLCDSEIKENGFENSTVDQQFHTSEDVDGKTEATLMVWLSTAVFKTLCAIHTKLHLNEHRPVRLLVAKQELNLEQSFASQGVREGTLIEVQETVRDIHVQSSPPPSADKECDVRPDNEDAAIQCHRVPSMLPQPLVIDCLFPEEGWRSVDEILQPDESIRDLMPKAAEQFHVPEEQLAFVFQVGIVFPLPEATGHAIQVMRGSSRQYIDERGREVKEDERICQTLTPLHADDLPAATPIGKPVVIMWRKTIFLELGQHGQTEPLADGIVALEDKKYCAFYRALHVTGVEKRNRENDRQPFRHKNGVNDESSLGNGKKMERLFLRVTALIYVDAATGEVFADEERALTSCDSQMDPDSVSVHFLVVLVPENRSFPKYCVPKNRYLAVFTREGEHLQLSDFGALRRLNEPSHSRVWMLPKEMPQLMRDLTQYFVTASGAVESY